MKDVNNTPSPMDSDTGRLSDEAPSSLAELLRESKPRRRHIDQVAAHLSEIVEARGRKITWDAIADALNMNRGTLINAVKTLTTKQAGKRRLAMQALNTVSPKPLANSAEAINNPAIHAHSEPTNADTRLAHAENVGITPLGRARIEKFNL